MLGAIVGDSVGSVYEFDNFKSKDFIPFAPYHGNYCFATDDSIMTLAIAKAVLETDKGNGTLPQNAVRYMQGIGKQYPYCGFGGNFYCWIFSDDPKPYGSYGNGSAMRVSPVAYAAKSIEEAIHMADEVTCVTHSHPQGMLGAEATAACVWLALHGHSREDIGQYVNAHFYKIDFTIDEIRPTYRFNETCQDTVPQAIRAFLESTDFEDALRTAVSVGGDSDTLAAITCSIAGAYYGVPQKIAEKASIFLDPDLLDILDDFEARFC